MHQATEEELLRRIKNLSERLWEGRCTEPDIHAWLSNFDGRHCGDLAIERLHALHLLASVSYFGLVELRVLLRSMFRNLFRYPLIQAIRTELNGSRDVEKIHQRFQDELNLTRFMGVGNPAESGTHLLYYFRQENRLNRRLFVNHHEVLTGAVSDMDSEFVPVNLKRIVFIDDLCGSGEQAIRYSQTLLRDLSQVAVRRGQQVEFHYLVLFGTTDGMKRARELTSFTSVEAVFELDETYPTYGHDSRVFRRPPPGIDRSISEMLSKSYGSELWGDWPLGFDDGQLLLALHHNVPDNTLPIVWYDENPSSWTPVFPRYPKVG